MSPETVNGIYALGGATLGAVLTGIISWIISKRRDKILELTTISTVPTKLIEVDYSLSDVVTVTIGGKVVPSIYSFDTRIFNSGTETINGVDILVDVVGPDHVLGRSFGKATFDVAKEECSVVANGENGTKIHFDYLNAGDEIVVKFLVSDKPDEVNVKFRQPDVKHVLRSNYDPLVPGVLGRAFFDAIRSNAVLHLYMRLALPQYRHYLGQISEKDQDAT